MKEPRIAGLFVGLCFSVGIFPVLTRLARLIIFVVFLVTILKFSALLSSKT